MKLDCDYCGKEIKIKPSKMKEKNYCDKACRGGDKRDKYVCGICGKVFSRLRCASSKNNFCSLDCSKQYTSIRMSGLNQKMNPARMTPITRAKLRTSRLSDKSVSYPKYYGRHEHRIIAESMLGRPLIHGEVVHHINGDRRNNSPLNLMVFRSQKDHAVWHQNELKDPSLNYEY